MTNSIPHHSPGTFLRPIDNIPISKLTEWQNDADLRRLTMGFRFPVQETSVREWLDAVSKRNGRESAYFSIFHEDVAVGVCLIQEIDWINRSGSVGIYVADNTHRNRGIGSAAMLMLLQFAFTDINLNRISLQVLEDNIHAISIYEKIGFLKEGLEEQSFFQRGKFCNTVRMAIISERFLGPY